MSFRFQSADRIIGQAMAEVLRPLEPMLPSEWATVHLTVPDGPSAGAPIDLGLTPYLVEPLNFLGPDSGVNELAVMKSAQSGFTLLLLAIVGFMIDQAPCQILLIQPTSDALSDFNRLKLDPSIRASAVLSKKVAAQTSRSGAGSTMHNKAFAGGALTLAIASSAADLRSKTVKVLLRDEIDEYEDDLDGQGSPLDLSDGRLVSFLASGDWRKADVSTPTIKGASKIERRYEAGDRRRWHVPCPHCDGEFTFEFGPNFRYETTYPFSVHYIAPCCGSIIEAADKNVLVRKGRWIPGASRPGAFPSYSFDALSSPFVPWEKIAEERVAAGDDPQRLKTFWNLWLGLPYEMRGDAPDHVRLLERREEGLTRGHIPARGLFLVASADVQMRGIWVEVIAIAPTRETWVVDVLYLDGPTESPDSESFKLLEQLLDRTWPDAFGRVRKLDALGVDSGYRSHVVYAWTRENQRVNPLTSRADVVLALKGRDGWGQPAIGTPSLVDVDMVGRRQRKGAKVWPVGTWPLKAAFYEDLRKEGIKSGKAADPEGYCHFPSWLDETYFRQITSEYLAEEKFKGRVRKFWKLRHSERDNHLLDCRVYNLALIEHLGLSALTAEDWAYFERLRGAPAGVEAMPAPPEEVAPAKAEPEVLEPPAPARGMSWREMMERRANV